MTHFAKDLDATCTECGADVVIGREPRYRRLLWRKHGRAYCSDRCRDAWVSRESSERMAATNRRHASERMKVKNPMRIEKAREQMATTLRAIGHKPALQGGNGRPMTDTQWALLELLGAGWEAEYVVATGRPRVPGRPTCYKIDLADPGNSVAVEVDGRSHLALARRAADERKDEFLRSHGWTVLRFTNDEVRADVAGCAARCVR